MKTHGCEKPCAECPFARATAPGQLGGSFPTVFIGQAYGPFMLSCHMDPAYAADRRSPDLLQCAGAAIFRANVGVAALMPKKLHALPADGKLVFATPAELLAHHARMDPNDAERFMRNHPPEQHRDRELQDIGVQRVEPRVK